MLHNTEYRTLSQHDLRSAIENYGAGRLLQSIWQRVKIYSRIRREGQVV